MRGRTAGDRYRRSIPVLKMSLPMIVLICGCAAGVTGPDGPPAPTGLQISLLPPDTVTLNWTDNSEDEEGFTIWRSATRNGPYAALTTVGPDETTATLTGLDLSLVHFFRVSARSGTGESRLSNTVGTAATVLKVGEAVPDFVSVDQNGQNVSVHALSGKIRLLYFARLKEG